MGMTEDKFVGLTSCEKEINKLVDAYLLALYLADANVLVGSSHICSIPIDVCVCVFSFHLLWAPSS